MPKIVPKIVQTKIFKIKKISKSQKSPKSFQKVSQRVLNKSRGGFFEKIFCPVFHGGSSLRKFSKKSKIFQNSKNAQNRSQKCPNVFWSCFRVIFSRKFFAQCSMEGRVFEKFQKNQKSFKIPKMPKFDPKSVQTCFEDVLGWVFRKNFLPSVPWRSSLRKFSKKSKKFQSSKNAQNRPQKCPNENIRNQKKFQNSKHAQNRYQKCPNVFWSCFRVILPRNFSAQCSMEGRDFENFQKNQKSFKILKMPKIVPKKAKQKFSKSKNFSKFQKSPKSFPKLSKRVLNMFWGDFLEKFFWPVFHGGSDLRKFSKKSKNFQKSKKAENRSQKCPNENFQNQKKFQYSKHAQNCSQKCPNVFWSCFRVILSKKLFAQCSMEGRVFENFQKNQKRFKVPRMPKIVPKSVQTKIFKIKKNFNIPNMPKKVPKSVQTCFEVVLGWFFRKNFLPSVPWRVESSKIFKKIKKVSKFQNAQNRPQKCPNENFQNQKNFQNSKHAQNIPNMPKMFPKASKRVLKLF